MSSEDLAGRRALITGASGGIGHALAVAFAAAGAELILTYSDHPDEAQAAASAAGGAVEVRRADLSRPGAGRALAEAVGQIDVFVANAGLGVRRAWADVDADLWSATFAVNTTAPWETTQALLPGMADRGFGRILYVSSVAALTGGVVGPHYAASKAALHGLLHHLAPRVAGSGVTVNAIAPALISGTRMLPGGSTPPIPVGRPGTPAEVAAMALSMVTNAYLTDKVITVDGGLHPY
jgi:3-oxoacyl-[acyl-carrier protein] reductase